MVRRLLLLLLIAIPLKAQLNPAPSSTGSITINASNCFTTNACIVLHMATSNVGYSVTVSGTWTGTLTIEQSGDNQGSWTSVTTTTSNMLYTSALTPGITDVRVRGSAAMTGSAVVTITASGPATLQNVTGGGISSVSSLPATCTPGVTAPVQLSIAPFGIFYCSAPNTWATSSADSGVIDPTGYGAKFDGKACFGNTNTITVTNASNQVTCNVGNFTSADVGKQFTASNGCCGTTANYLGVALFPFVAMHICKATDSGSSGVGVVNSTTINICKDSDGTAATATAGCTGVACIIAWATNDDTAITNAETAWQSSNKCRTFQIPAGIAAVLQTHWTTPGANCLAMEPQADYTAQVQGQGIGSSVIGLFSGFNLAGCGTNCFGGYLEQSWMNFQFNGFGIGNTGAASAKNLIGMGLGSQVSQVACNAFGGSDTNLTGLSSGLGSRVWGISIDGCGNTGWTIPAGITKAYYCFVGDELGAAVKISGGDFTDFGCDYGAQGGTQIITLAAGNERYHGIGSNLFACSSVANASVFLANNVNNVTIILDGARFNCTNTTSNGIFANGTGEKIVLTGGTVLGGTSSDLTTCSTCTVWIDDSVTLTHNTISGITTASGCALTSSVARIKTGKFASGTAGTCTVTLTLPTAPTGWTCDAHDTTTVADIINQTAFTTTSATISGTTASGDVITWKCSPF